MAPKTVKPQYMLGAYPPEYRQFAQTLLGSHRYAAHQLFDWTLIDILQGFGVDIETTMPQPAKELVFDLAATYARCIGASEPFADVLGPIYMQAGQGHDAMGQFFTPQHVARLMADVAMGQDPAKHKGLMTAIDPTAGSGIMMLSVVQSVLKRYGRNSLKNLSVSCVDLDRTCALMSAVQLLGNCCIHGIDLGEIFVCHGNSLWPSSQWNPIVHATLAQIEVGRDVAPANHEARKRAVAQAAAGASDGMFPWHRNDGDRAA